jgi:hypothetical protein
MTSKLKPEIPLIVSLLQAKLEILKLKSDGYAWAMVDKSVKDEIDDTYTMIMSYLAVLRNPIK